MIFSMTGFGQAIYEDDQIKISVEIRALNNKAFDFKLKFPNIPAEYFLKIRKLVSENLIRGKVDCSVQLTLKFKPNKYTIKKEVFADYFKQLNEIAKFVSYPSRKIDFFSIIPSFPDVLEYEILDLEPFWQKIENTILQALEKLNEFRLNEGLATEKDILKKLEVIEQSLNKVPDFERVRNENFRKKLFESLKANNITVEKERFEQEIIFYLDKYDINEEQKRLANHIKYFRQTLEDKSKEKGKKLTFIAQEMGREINTLGNKSYCVEIQKLVVLMKDNLEKIKEQLANVL